MRKISLPVAALSLTLAACGSPEEEEVADDMAVEQDAMAVDQQEMQAVAMLQTADGQQAGTATATQADGGVQIALEVQNMPAGEHGVHVHTTGACTPDFSAAGGHWNPTDQSHGLEDPEGQHAGDMPNLTVGEDGSGSLEYMLEGGATWDGLMDADGSAFIVHAGQDDQTTDPSGDSGDRLACGVFEAGGTATMASDTTT